MKTMAILALMAAALSAAHQAAADPVPADPVARCRGILRAIPPLAHGTATAEQIEPVGPHGCRFTGVTGENGQQKTSIGTVMIDRLDFERIYSGRLPDAVTLRMQDIVIRDEGQPPVLGPFEFIVDYDLDVRAKVLSLKELILRGAALGELTLSGEIEGYNLPAHGGFWPDAEDHETIRLRRFQLRALDSGFIRLALLGRFPSERESQAAIDDVKSEMSAHLARWPSFGVPMPAVTVLTAYVGDLPSPPRPITISVEPSTPIPLSWLDPFDARLRQAMERLNLAVSY